MFVRKGFYYQADASGGAGEPPPTPEPKPEPQSEEFTVWLVKQPEDVQKRFQEQYGKLDDALTAERKITKETRKAQTRLTELEAAEEKRKADAQTVEQKLQEDAKTERAAREAAEATLKAERIKNAVLLEANRAQFALTGDAKNKARFINADEAYLFVTQNGNELEIGDDGKVTGVLESLTKLAKDKQHLLEQPARKQSGGSPTGGIKAVTEIKERNYPIPRL